MAEPAGFTKADLELAAGARSYERGLGYLHAVADLEITHTGVTATVYGGSEYQVRLASGGGGISGACTCPYGQDGFFCKHCVAVGLSVLAIGDGLPEQIEASRVRREALESWLDSFSKEELLAELLAILDDDRNLRQRFELRALSADADAAAVRRAVMKLLVPSYGEYIGGDAYADDVDKAVAVIDELIKAGKRPKRSTSRTTRSCG
ncbi:MAG TPA: SWIM zinc finger family protein [Streptosporangiaceae bacterium]|nr:SWIM zinc finger family protein [Streptosporangiaceae bacterium]